MSRTIAITSQKGGVAKTTTAANLAVVWGAGGTRVLAVDLDPQFGLSRSFGVDPGTVDGGTHTAMMGGGSVAELAIDGPVDGVHLLAGHRDLRSLELTLASQVKREEFLREALAANASLYDVVLIDCPPNLGLLTVNALFAADEAIVPVSMKDPGGFQGAAEVVGMVNTLRERSVDLTITAIVRTLADPRRITYGSINEALPELGVPIASAEIPLRADFDNAMAWGKPLVAWRPASEGAGAYRELAAELAAVPMEAAA